MTITPRRLDRGTVGRRLVRRQRATARSRPAGSGSGSSFTLAISAANPLTPPGPTPRIDASLTGTVAPDGTLTLTVVTDRFPSYGLSVQRGGTLLYRGVLYNASCNVMTGPRGAARLVVGLNSITRSRDLTIPSANTGTGRSPPRCAAIGPTRADINRVARSALREERALDLLRLVARLL